MKYKIRKKNLSFIKISHALYYVFFLSCIFTVSLNTMKWWSLWFLNPFNIMLNYSNLKYENLFSIIYKNISCIIYTLNIFRKLLSIISMIIVYLIKIINTLTWDNEIKTIKFLSFGRFYIFSDFRFIKIEC